MSQDNANVDMKPPATSEESNEIQRWGEQLGKDYYVLEGQRDRGDRNLRFAHIPGGQWEGSDEQRWQNRIRMEFNKVSSAIHKFNGESQSNRKTVTYKPATDEGKDTARILNGLFRKDFRQSGGVDAYDDSINEMATATVGAYRLTTERSDPSDIESDKQKVVWKFIPNSYKTVVWDSNAREMSKKDARWGTILTPYTNDAFEEEFPGFQVASVGLPEKNDQFSLTRNFRWRSNDTIYVAERYAIKKKKKTAFIYDNIETGERKVIVKDQVKGIEDELLDMGFKKVGERKVMDQWVEKAIYSGTQMLEPSTRIPGKFIPIIAVYGYRTFVDDAEFVTGLMDNFRDAQRLVNMVLSKYAEISSTQPKEVPIFTTDQVEGLQQQWATQHQGQKPYAVVKPVKGPNGEIAHLGPVGKLTPPAADQHGQMLLQFSSDFIREETAGAPQDFSDPDASGIAIEKIIERINMDQKPLFTNIERSLVRCGEVYRSIRADIALTDEDVTLLSDDLTESRAKVNEVIMDEESGNLKVINDLSKGEFEVVVDTGASFSTQRNETVDRLSRMLESSKDLPAMAPYTDIMANTIFRNMDGIGTEGLQKLARRLGLEGGFIEPETPEDEDIVQQAQQAQSQPDPQQEAQNALFTATAKKEEAEAQERQSKTLLNTKTAEKTQAQTREILAGIGLSQAQFGQSTRENADKMTAERDKIRAQFLNERIKENAQAPRQNSA